MTIICTHAIKRLQRESSVVDHLNIFQVVGLSCVDVVSTLISVAEFQDNESFSNLESLVVTLAPKECLLIQGEGSYEFQNLKQVCIEGSCLCT